MKIDIDTRSELLGEIYAMRKLRTSTKIPISNDIKT